MKIKKTKLSIVLILSLVLNLVFFKADILPLLKRHYLNKTTTFLADNVLAKDFSNKLKSGTIKSLESKYTAGEDLILHRDVRASIFPAKFEVQEYGEYGFLMWMTLKTAHNKNYLDLSKLIKNRFDEFFLSKNQVLIERPDQSIYGCIAIELYKKSKDIKYKYFADEIYKKLKNRVNSYGVIPYKKKSENQEVDVLGFVVPFLSLYSKTFNNSSAMDYSVKLIEEFIKYGVDGKTGLPSQSYNFKYKIKLGYSNWSRGFGWYALALSHVDYDLFPDSEKNRILLFENTIYNLFKENMSLSQFQGRKQKYNIDMSATMPILYFLIVKEKIKLNKVHFINFFSKYVMSNGQVGFNSAGIQYKENGFTMPYLRHDLSQGIMFLIYEELLEN